MIDLEGTVSASYIAISLAVSIAAMVLALLNVLTKVRLYHEHHDDRASIDLATSIVHFALASAMTFSAWGLMTNDLDLRLAAQGAGRSALLTLLIIVTAYEHNLSAVIARIITAIVRRWRRRQ